MRCHHFLLLVRQQIKVQVSTGYLLERKSLKRLIIPATCEMHSGGVLERGLLYIWKSAKEDCCSFNMDTPPPLPPSPLAWIRLPGASCRYLLFDFKTPTPHPHPTHRPTSTPSPPSLENVWTPLLCMSLWSRLDGCMVKKKKKAADNSLLFFFSVGESVISFNIQQ